MASFTSDGVQIAYDDIAPPGGAERTIVLIHGFASNRNEGWKRTGWYAAFERRRMRVIALDQRGHGESAKLYEPQDYERETAGRRRAQPDGPPGRRPRRRVRLFHGHAHGAGSWRIAAARAGSRT